MKALAFDILDKLSEVEVTKDLSNHMTEEIFEMHKRCIRNWWGLTRLNVINTLGICTLLMNSFKLIDDNQLEGTAY